MANAIFSPCVNSDSADILGRLDYNGAALRGDPHAVEENSEQVFILKFGEN